MFENLLMLISTCCDDGVQERISALLDQNKIVGVSFLVIYFMMVSRAVFILKINISWELSGLYLVMLTDHKD